jgi:hypothetical protein
LWEVASFPPPLILPSGGGPGKGIPNRLPSLLPCLLLKKRHVRPCFFGDKKRQSIGCFPLLALFCFILCLISLLLATSFAQLLSVIVGVLS